MIAKFQDLTPRLASSLFLVGIGSFALWAGQISFVIFIGFVVGLMYYELSTFPTTYQRPNKQKYTHPIVGALGFFLVLGSCLQLLSDPQQSFFYLLLAFIVSISLLIVGVRSLSSACLFLAMIYSSLGLALLYQVNVSWVIVVIIAVIGTDVGGYFAGKLIGGPKFIPKISPNKTWAGVIGGWLLAIILGIILAMYFTNLNVALTKLAGILFFVSVASQIGDLSFSWLKRQAGLSNSSNLLPGHGGFMDRFDGLTGAGLFVLILQYWEF